MPTQSHAATALELDPSLSPFSAQEPHDESGASLGLRGESHVWELARPGPAPMGLDGVKVARGYCSTSARKQFDSEFATTWVSFLVSLASAAVCVA